MAYARWCHWRCGQTQLQAATINQFACPSYSLYVQLLWYPMYYPKGMKARVGPVQWSKPNSILIPTQDSKPGGRIQNHKRWPLHYHCTQHGFIKKRSTCTQLLESFHDWTLALNDNPSDFLYLLPIWVYQQEDTLLSLWNGLIILTHWTVAFLIV